jgi:murein DD-endopeptidase MepM/ murein hydrolase activator NlpD
MRFPFKTRLPLLAAALLALSSAPVRASDLPQFSFPLGCTLGVDCWVAKYVDVDPAKDSAKDFTCGVRTEEAHEGTDFAIRSFAELEQGVDVLAARDGTVLRLRDGEKDGPKTESQFDEIKKETRECGNGVVIDHGSGLFTFYCHLKKGSITVEADEDVKAGEKIAEVGQSGLAEFPHLHFAVIWEDGHIDPFTGEVKEAGCGKLSDNLWRDDQPYEPMALYDGGFTEHLPDFTVLEAGQDRPDGFSAVNNDESAALVFWIGYFGAVEGDEVNLIITAPDGSLYAERAEVQPKTRTRQYYYVGKKRAAPLQPGNYIGTATVRRAGIPEQRLERRIEISP